MYSLKKEKYRNITCVNNRLWQGTLNISYMQKERKLKYVYISKRRLHCSYVTREDSKIVQV